MPGSFRAHFKTLFFILTILRAKVKPALFFFVEFVKMRRERLFWLESIRKGKGTA